MRKMKLLLALVACGIVWVGAASSAVCQSITATAEERSLVPVGVELTDDELLAVDGQGDVLTVAATMIVYGGIGAIGDLAGQLYAGNGVDWGEVGIAFGVGATGGFAKIAAIPFVRAGLVTALRWNAVAGAAIQRGVTTAARATGNVLYSGIKATANAFSAAWDWITTRLP